VERGQRHLLAAGAYSRPPYGDLAAAQHHFAADSAGAGGTALGHMGIPRPTDGRAILLEHRFQHLQARTDSELEQLAARINEQIDEGQVTRRFNSGGTSDCARLSHGGSFYWEAFASVWPPLVYHEQ
jgi:hypothetical protein